MFAVNNNLMAANTANALNTHYGNLQTSIQRLSSGLRINSAADDAAGLAIRELMRSDIAALNQGVRNANDAISMLQTFDGALGIIDEKLIRLKELSEQAATGTYDSTQRLMIDSEFQAMKNEIDRIARATDFNGIKMIDGNFGVGRTETKVVATATGVGATMIQKGTATINNAGTNLTASKYNAYLTADTPGPVNGFKDVDLKVTESTEVETVTEVNQANGPHFQYSINGFFPASGNPVTDEIRITYSEGTWSCTIMDGKTDVDGNVVNTTITGAALSDSNGVAYARFFDNDYFINLTAVAYNQQPLTEADLRNLDQDKCDKTIGLELSNKSQNYKRTYKLDEPVVKLSSSMGTATYAKTGDDTGVITARLGNGDTVSLNYTGGIPALNEEINFRLNITGDAEEKTVPIPDEDSRVKIHFGTMNDSAEDYYYLNKFDATTKGLGLDDVDVKTQDNAQNALVSVNDAIVEKDKIRSYYGAMQNRLENTITNLRAQAENLQDAESRISDADIAQTMMEFVKEQILSQSATAMLAQANSLPQMVLKLIE